MTRAWRWLAALALAWWLTAALDRVADALQAQAEACERLAAAQEDRTELMRRYMHALDLTEETK